MRIRVTRHWTVEVSAGSRRDGQSMVDEPRQQVRFIGSEKAYSIWKKTFKLANNDLVEEKESFAPPKPKHAKSAEAAE
jgi:hypothetical protein